MPTTAKRSTTSRRSTARPRKTAASMNKPSPGISRIDQPSRRTHGYFVRLDYRKTAAGWRPRMTAFFGDASHGGRRASWRAAESWLARMRRSLGKGKRPAA